MPGRRGFELPSDFWTQLVAKRWEREPAVFPALFEGPLLTPAEAFETFVAAFEAYGAGAPGTRPRCYLEGNEVNDGPGYARFFPDPARDRSLDDYAARISPLLGGHRFCVVINAFHVHSRELWLRLRGFLRGLYAATGLPAARTEPVFFFGDYLVTPFGIHTDEASVFTFCLGDSKRMLLWPREYFARRDIGMVEDRLLAPHPPFGADAIDLSVGPRDLLYWPSSHWHVGVSEGRSVHTSLGVGVYFGSTRDELLAQVIRAAGGNVPLPPLPSSTALPPALEQALEAANPAALRRELHAEWLRRVSSDGVQPPPALKPVALDPKERLQLADGGPILHVPFPDGLLIAAEGHSWFLGPGPGHAWDPAGAAALLETIDELNRGERVRIGPAVKRSGLIAKVLEDLVAAGAIRPV